MKLSELEEYLERYGVGDYHVKVTAPGLCKVCPMVEGSIIITMESHRESVVLFHEDDD